MWEEQNQFLGDQNNKKITWLKKQKQSLLQQSEINFWNVEGKGIDYGEGR